MGCDNCRNPISLEAVMYNYSKCKEKRFKQEIKLNLNKYCDKYN